MKLSFGVLAVVVVAIIALFVGLFRQWPEKSTAAKTGDVFAVIFIVIVIGYIVFELLR